MSEDEKQHDGLEQRSRRGEKSTPGNGKNIYHLFENISTYKQNFKNEISANITSALQDESYT